MHNALIIYSSTDGHTETICKRISNFLNNKNETKIISLDEATKIDLTVFNKIIIGASIRYGKHSKKLYKFITLNKNVLDQKQSIFFSVNVVARKSEKNTPKTNPYMKKFLKLSPWKPQNLAVFAGKIDYQSYKFIDKHMIRFIMWIGKGPTNLKGSYELQIGKL